MTENETMSVLHYLLGCENAVDAGEIDEHNCLNSQEKEALKFVLEEIQQYRAIGTIDEFKALKEKNEPKKVNKTIKNEIGFYHCPRCQRIIGTSIVTTIDKHCSKCGQAFADY